MPSSRRFPPLWSIGECGAAQPGGRPDQHIGVLDQLLG